MTAPAPDVPDVPEDGTAPFVVDVTLTRREVIAVARAFPRLRRDLLRLAVGTVVLAAVGLLLPVALFGSALPLGPLLVVPGLGWLLAVTVLAPWAGVLLRPARHGVGLPVRWTLGPEGLGLSSARSTGVMSWGRIAEVTERRRVLAFRTVDVPDWVAGLPADRVPAPVRARVEGWVRTAAPGADVVPEPSVTTMEDGDLVLVHPITPRLARTMLWGAAGAGPPLVALVGGTLSVGLVLLVRDIAGSSGALARGAALAGVVLVVVLLGVAVDVVGRRQLARGPRGGAWRFGPQSVGLLAAGSWVHTPWSGIATVDVRRRAVLLELKDPRRTLAFPADLPARDDLDRVLAWARAAGTTVRDGRR